MNILVAIMDLKRIDITFVMTAITIIMLIFVFVLWMLFKVEDYQMYSKLQSDATIATKS